MSNLVNGTVLQDGGKWSAVSDRIDSKGHMSEKEVEFQSEQERGWQCGAGKGQLDQIMSY